MARGRKSNKNLSSEQRDAIRLTRSAASVSIAVNGYAFEISRADAIDAIEKGFFGVVCMPKKVNDVMTGFDVYMKPVVKPVVKEEEEKEEAA